MVSPEDDNLALLFLVVLLGKQGFEIRLPQTDLDAAQKQLESGTSVQFWQLPDMKTVMACLIFKQL